LIDFALYKRLLNTPGRLRVVVWGFLARLPNGMNGLALTLGAQQASGRFDIAGLVTACFFVASAIATPLSGRLIDKNGPKKVVPWMTAIYALAMVGFFALPANASAWAYAGFAAVAGATLSSIGGLLRAMWTKSNLSEDDKRAAFSFEGMVTEMVFMFGPLLVSLTLMFGSQRYAVLLCALFCAAGTYGFARAGGLAYWGEVERNVKRHWLGPMRSRKFLWLTICSLFIGIAFGMNELFYIAFSKAVKLENAVGVLYFMTCLSSATGALWFGGYKPNMPLPRLFQGFALSTAIFMGGMAWVSSFYWMMGVAFCAGAFVGALISGVFSRAVQSSQTRYATEAGNWVASALMSGLGLGFALGGVILQHQSWSALALWSALPMLVVIAFLFFDK
jgi:MFS family permease